MTVNTKSNERLIYGFDPLCGWCFAFRPSMHAIRAAHPDLPITLIMGGLVVGERVAPIAEMRDYLKSGLEQVRRTAGVVAGAAFYNGLLAEGTYISNSEPPCRAIYVAQQIAPEQVFDFADALAEAMYIRGLPIDNEAVLAELATAHGINAAALLEGWRSDAAHRGLQRAWAIARAAGFNSYPTLVYQRGEQLTLVAQGFAPPAQAVERVTQLRSTAAPTDQNR